MKQDSAARLAVWVKQASPTTLKAHFSGMESSQACLICSE
jgi:hypothetical protein